MNGVQRDYYRLPSAAAAFDTRVAAIRQVLVPGSRIVDVGCNDGRVSLALLGSGHASSSIGIDFEDIASLRDPALQFIAADLRETGASVVPAADAILCLNVLHHLLLAGPQFVRDFVRALLDRAETVLVDLGSLTEKGPWAWRHLMARVWRSDEEVAHDLFSACHWRRPLCSYPSQNGVRTLWKLSTDRISGYEFEVEQRYRRTIATAPSRKRLVPVDDETEVPAGCTDEVQFFRLRRRETEERFWAKKYGPPRTAEWRQDTERIATAFLRQREPAAVVPIGEHPDLGRIYPFDEELFSRSAVHYFDRHYLPRPVQRRYEQLVQETFDSGPFAGLPVGLITDPQAIVTSRGVAFFDFEPSHQCTELVRFLHGASPSQRFEVLRAFYDVSAPQLDALPASVRREIELALRTELFCGIARERLRVRRNRALRAAARSLTRANPVSVLRSAFEAVHAEWWRTRRKGPRLRLALRTLWVRPRSPRSS